MTRLLRALVSACLLALIVIFPVVGHAELEESDPAEGATITTPYTLTATFSEDFNPDPDASFIRVQNVANDVVAEGGHSDQEATMSVELPAPPPGQYFARWQTTTIDDNAVEHGTITFTVEASPTPAPIPTVAPTQPPGSTATPQPTATTTPVPTAAPTPSATPISPTDPVGGSTDVLLALAVGVAVVGALAFFLVRRSRT